MNLKEIVGDLMDIVDTTVCKNCGDYARRTNSCKHCGHKLELFVLQQTICSNCGLRKTVEVCEDHCAHPPTVDLVYIAKSI